MSFQYILVFLSIRADLGSSMQAHQLALPDRQHVFKSRAAVAIHHLKRPLAACCLFVSTSHIVCHHYHAQYVCLLQADVKSVGVQSQAGTILTSSHDIPCTVRGGLTGLFS